MVFDLVVSGWSFFFRWPIANARTFREQGVFLGPLLQMLVYLIFSFIAWLIVPAAFAQVSVFAGWIGLSLLTGLFHEDGLADTADSLGVSKFDSGASLEKIHSTFKDPRLGTFGVSALVLFWLSRHSIASSVAFTPLLGAVVCLLSRAVALGFGLFFYSRVPSSRSARSSHVMQNVGLGTATACLLSAVALGLLFCFGLHVWVADSFWSLDHVKGFVFVPVVLSLAFLVPIVVTGVLLWLLVRRTEALNGDLLGATVCCSELLISIGVLLLIESFG